MDTTLAPGAVRVSDGVGAHPRRAALEYSTDDRGAAHQEATRPTRESGAQRNAKSPCGKLQDRYCETRMDLAIHADAIPDFWQVNDPKRPSGKRRDATLK